MGRFLPLGPANVAKSGLAAPQLPPEKEHEHDSACSCFR